MDLETAVKHLTDSEKRKVSELGNAVAVLYQKYGSYKNISQKYGIPPGFLSNRHRLFRLPKGIQWQIDEGYIGIGQGYQISRLKKEDDQWLLTFTIIEEKLNKKECKNAVNEVLNQNHSLRDTLSTYLGIRFDKIQPLLLPIGFDLRFAISRAAWSHKENWEDLCYRLIRQGLNVNMRNVANQLKTIAKDLEKAEIMEDSANRETESPKGC